MAPDQLPQGSLQAAPGNSYRVCRGWQFTPCGHTVLRVGSGEPERGSSGWCPQCETYRSVRRRAEPPDGGDGQGEVGG